MRIACYLRVSTSEQADEGYSIAAQKNRLEAFCTSQGWDIVRWYIDEGISAKDTKRPELQSMLNGVRKKVFDVVLVYRLDRLTRSVLDMYQLLQEFEQHNVKFKSATEVYDTTTATGRLFLTLIASLAEWERQNLGERVSFGMEEKAKQGKWTVSTPPFGYSKEGEELVINESEAALVRRIYRTYLEGSKGMSKIAMELTQAGYRTNSNSLFTAARLKYILTNPIYIGTLRYNYRVNTENYFEVENAAPPIIDKEDFERVQALVDQRAVLHPRHATSPYIFSTALRCQRCRSRFSSRFSQTKRKGTTYVSRQYMCIGKKQGICDMPNISQNFLEIQFLKWLESINFDKESKMLSTDAEKDHTEDIERIEGEIKQIEG
ncbi:recombinase family protein [Rossellomorea vietnamensis]|uniref:Recombinase family protein n=1 Tax=Rossellomorea vietnamensis TaxID=218284 RepID=A0A5D4KF83_9BACI|nr:recombinase family protein [Rossellomorea vietnamensis]TYR75539.1 recombinase family protein [Rossellomorea vietnamensis]